MNPSPYRRNEVIKVYLDTPCEYNIWDFDIVNSNGNKVDAQFVYRKEEVVPVNDLYSRPLPFYIDRHCFYMETGNIPAGGYQVYRMVPTKNFNRKAVFWADMRTSNGDDISKSLNILENEFLKIEVQNNGTISIFEKLTQRSYKDLNYLEDSGDCGDYWTYYPPHHNKTFTSQGCHARIWLEDNGPLSATIAAEVKMMLPAYALRPENEIRGESRRSSEEKELTATTYYTLKRGSKKVDVKLKVDNTIEDHRLRVLFDTGIKAEFSDAAGHFTVDRRPINPAKNVKGEYWPEMQTLPQQNFVDISDGKAGVALLNNCITEFEAINNDKGTLALTLLRSIRNIICTEFRSAGVFPRQKGGQSLGMQEYEYDIYPHEGNWQNAEVYNQAESLNVLLKPVQTCKHQGGDLPLQQSFFSVEPSELILSTFKKAEDRDSFILRLFNPADETIEGSIKVYAKIIEAYYTDLNEQRLENLPVIGQHSFAVKAKGNQIITLEIVS